MVKRKGMIGHNPLAWLSDVENKPKKSAGNKKNRARATDKKATPKKKLSSKKSTKKKTTAKKSVAKTPIKEKAVIRKKVKTVPKKSMKSNDTNPKERVIELLSMQTIAQVSDLHKQWMDMLNSEGDIALDGSQVTSIDAASLQLIYTLWKEANKMKKNISWLNPSAALCDATRLMGMESGLQLSKAA